MIATFRQLRLFLALSEHGGVTAAARACHVTQPTASMQLKDLADAVGLSLFEHVGRRLRLTEAGEALAQTARATVDEWAAFEQRIAAMKGLARGRLSVAVVSTAQYFVPRMLGDFFALHPDIEVALEVQNRDGVVARLRENRDDLYVMSIPPDDIDVDRHPFLPNPLVVISAASHPLAGKPKVPLRRLATERFVLREPGSGTRMACDAHFAKHGFQPKLRLALGSNEAIKQAVAGGLGLAVVSWHALAARPIDEDIAVLDVRSFPIQSSWWILGRRGRRLSPIAAVFLEHLKRAAGSASPAAERARDIVVRPASRRR